MPKTVLALQVGKIDTNTFDAMLKRLRLRSDELPAILASGSLVQRLSTRIILQVCSKLKT